MFLGVVLITRNPHELQTALYTPLIGGEVVVDVGDPIIEDFPEPFSLPTPILPLGLNLSSPLRLSSSFEAPSNAGRRLSGLFQILGSSVGTHSIRRMELDHLLPSPSRQ